MFVVVVQSRSVFEIEVCYADARLALHAAYVEAHFDIHSFLPVLVEVMLCGDRLHRCAQIGVGVVRRCFKVVEAESFVECLEHCQICRG